MVPQLATIVAAGDWLDFAIQNLTRERYVEAIESARSVLALTEYGGGQETRDAAGLVQALARLSATYAEVAPLLDTAIRENPHGLGEVARRVKRLGQELA